MPGTSSWSPNAGIAENHWQQLLTGSDSRLGAGSRPEAHDHPFTAVPIRCETMSKLQRSNKEGKKQAILTPKEKKAAKQVKKHAGDVAPLIVTVP